MIKRFLLAALVVASLALVSNGRPTKVVGVVDRSHPRLLFTSADIPALQAKVRQDLGAGDIDHLAYVSNTSYADTLLGFSGSGLISTYWGMYSIVDLGMAYRLALDTDTKKAQYQSKCKEGLQALSAYSPELGDPFDPSIRLEVLSLGFDLCYDDLPAESSIPADRQALIDEILTYLDSTFLNNWEWEHYIDPPYATNKAILLGSAVGLGSIVLRGETTNTARLDYALTYGQDMLDAQIPNAFDADGSAQEGDLYGPFAMRYLIPYIEARQRYDGLDLSTLPQIRNFVNYLAYAVMPNGVELHSNDINGNYTGIAWNNTYQHWAQAKYGSQLARWVAMETWPGYWSQSDLMAAMLWNQGVATVPVGQLLPNSKLFMDRGMYLYRSAWPALNPAWPSHPNGGDAEQTEFSFYAGVFAGGHKQEDQGTFSLFRNYLLSPDSGNSGTMKESEAHNMVIIDGQGQHNAGDAIGTDGHIVSANLNGFADYLQADLKDAYTTYSPLNNPNAPRPGIFWDWGYYGANPVLKADRHALVIKPSAEAGELFVFYDDIDKDGNPHTYDWTWHTFDFMSWANPDQYFLRSANPVVVIKPGLYSPPMRINAFFANPTINNYSFSAATYTRGADDPNTTRIKATLQNVVNPGFLVALQAVSEGLTVEPTQSTLTDVTGAVAARFNWPTVTDDVYFRRDPATTIQHGTLLSDAKMVLARRNGSGTITKFSLGQGTTLTDGSTNLATVTGGTASVSSDGTEVSVSDPALQYSVYGPNVISVRSNNQPIVFTRSGDYVLVNAPAAALTIDPDSIRVTNVTGTTATVTWTTNQPSFGQVDFGLSTVYGATQSMTGSSSTQNVVTLVSLTPGTTYHFRVFSVAGSNAVSSNDSQFTTSPAPPPDTTPPAAVIDLQGS